MLLQELWLHNLARDKQVPRSLASRWLRIREDMTNLSKVTLPRWITSYSHSLCELHGFSDASQLAMSAALYLRVHSPSIGPKITLICSKTKVSPLRKLTIPRLELTDALMLAKLFKYVQATLHVDVNSIYLWTDSSVTLTWIKSHAARWKDFVCNRVLQIQDLVPSAHWRHVPGKENPAHCASRGIDTLQLIAHDLWWTGPTWLTRSPDAWPSNKLQHDQACEIEARPGLALIATLQREPQHWESISRYSNLMTLLRVTATLFRVLQKLRKVPKTSMAITPSDLEQARKFWIKSTQAAYFVQELKLMSANLKLPPTHTFTRLTAYIDAEGILRVGGRLQHSQLDSEGKHPAILPKKSPLTTLIISEAHLKTFHGGVQLTLSTLRQRYWIIGGRYPVKSHILQCVQCARQRGVRAQQLMGQLPQARVTPSRPFYHTGVDYAGPITIKTWRGRGAKTHKAWACSFVCMATSAVHLELVGDCSTEAFIASYRRLISRRGICQTLYSDCGKNFIRADKEIKKLFTQYNREHQVITCFLVNQGTRWTINPPAAPHMGEKWESVVKSMKYHLSRTVKDALHTFEEFTTLLTQIEALPNSRPLEPLSDDPDDPVALTPGHFLVGDALTALPEPTLIDIKHSRLNRWQLIQQRTEHFWARWARSYLQQRQSMSKWFHERNEVKEGSLVLITDERFSPSKWPLARVQKLHPGSDGIARVATLKTATTIITRPLVKLALLPIVTTTHSDEQSHDTPAAARGRGGVEQQSSTPLLMAGGNV